MIRPCHWWRSSRASKGNCPSQKGFALVFACLRVARIQVLPKCIWCINRLVHWLLVRLPSLCPGKKCLVSRTVASGPCTQNDPFRMTKSKSDKQKFDQKIYTASKHLQMHLSKVEYPNQQRSNLSMLNLMHLALNKSYYKSYLQKRKTQWELNWQPIETIHNKMQTLVHHQTDALS